MKKLLAILTLLLATPVFAVTTLPVSQGGTGVGQPGGFSPNSIITSGTTKFSPLVATSSNPLYIARIVATSTTASSTFGNGITLTGGCFFVGGACLTSGGSGSSFDYPFTNTTNYGQTVGATSTALWLQGSPFSLFASTTAVFVNASTTNSSNVGYWDIYGSVVPATPATGAIRLQGFTQNGITRLLWTNETDFQMVYGQDALIKVKNTTASIMTAGQVVYVSGSTGAVPNVALAKADALATSNSSIGVVHTAIAVNGFGQIQKLGVLDNVDTSAFASGDVLYLSTSTAGALTKVKPVYPYFVRGIGTVLNSGVGNGSIDVNIAPFLGNTESGTNVDYTAGSQFTVLGSTTLQNFTAKNATTTSLYVIGTSTGITSNSNFGAFDLIDFNSIDLNAKLGYGAGKNIVSGATNNTFVGYHAGFSSSTASTNGADNNTAVGSQTLNNNTSGAANTAVGYQSLFSNTSGFSNLANGYQALFSNTAGSQNTAFGRETMYYNTTGSQNTAIGYQSGLNNVGGSENISIGFNSQYWNVSGNQNSSFGTYALTNALGSGNVAIGYRAGFNETGSNTFYLDNQDRTSSALEKTQSLMYGVFSATPSTQLLTVNASTTISQAITVLGSATSTFVGNGIKITGDGCFDLRGTCVGAGSASPTLVDSIPFDWCSAQFTNTSFFPGGAFDDFASSSPAIQMMNATSSRVLCSVHIPKTYSSGPSVIWGGSATTSGRLIVDVNSTTTVRQFGGNVGGPLVCGYGPNNTVESNASSTVANRLDIVGNKDYPVNSTSTAISLTLTGGGNLCVIFDRYGSNASDTLENGFFFDYKPYFQFTRLVN